MIRVSVALVLIFAGVGATANGVRGVVTTDAGEPLAYATIFVKETGTGTVANERGAYELSLPDGIYQLVFQYLGYETAVERAEVAGNWLTLDVQLKTQVTVLETVTVRAGSEDPAYTIMRKAIAKAGYHRNQLDRYSARVYIKGTGRLKDYPWLAKRALEKEGVEKGRVYISESVSEIEYTRPSQFKERVISIYSDGKDNNTSPNPFIFGSFYEPEIAGTMSPLSPRAFSYYKFEYQGTFQDREFAVSRIKVTPRSPGDNVVKGMLYIVEDWWSIHSLDLETTRLGIGISIHSNYAPVEDKVWLPVVFRFGVEGKVFGFEFDYKYLATISNYAIQLNPELYVDHTAMAVIDENLEVEQAKQLETQFNNKNRNDSDLQERLASGKEITRKELRTLVKEYEKEELKRQEEPEVVTELTYDIDSTAFQKDSLYWSTIRPVPLTTEEIVGYRKTDSLAAVQKRRDAGDTLKDSRHKGFQPWDLLIGDHYKTGAHSNFQIHPPGGGFNTVEGFYLIYKLTYGVILQDTGKTRLSLSPVFRYGFSRKSFNGHLAFDLRNKHTHFQVDGGRYVEQYNPDDPIWPAVNTFTTLFLEKNLMKLYERDFISLSYQRKLNHFYGFKASFSWATRRELFNSSNYKLINRDDIEDYTPNRPENIELADTGFPEHRAAVGSLGFTARPWLKFRIRNGVRYEIEDSSPTMKLTYQRGLGDFLGSDVSFEHLDVAVRHELKIGVRGRLSYLLTAGKFLSARSLYFMDYKHFPGNQTPFSTSDPVGGFRLLDYYRYSTADRYFTGHVHYQFRKFAFTRIPLVRMTGISESLFVNYLATPSSQQYTEAGYAIDGIFRLFRLEAIASFQDGQYLSYGFRIGITSNFQFNFTQD